MEMKIEPLALPGVDTQRPIVIAGPCSAETEEQVLETAQGLASRGVKIFRAGIWKPRTKPGGFEGTAYNFNFLDQDLDANLYSLILAYEKSDEVVALQKEVQTSYNEEIGRASCRERV